VLNGDIDQKQKFAQYCVTTWKQCRQKVISAF